MGIRLANAYDRRASQFLVKDVKDQAARILVQVFDRFIENDPTWLMRDKSGEGEFVLVLVAQFLFPASRAIEILREMAKLHPFERGYIFLTRKLRWLGRVAKSSP
jgi:hypothetical protein